MEKRYLETIPKSWYNILYSHLMDSYKNLHKDCMPCYKLYFGLTYSILKNFKKIYDFIVSFTYWHSNFNNWRYTIIRLMQLEKLIKNTSAN